MKPAVILMRQPDRRVGMHVVHRVIQHDLDALGVRRRNKRLQLGHRAKVAVRFARVARPVAVVARVFVAIGAQFDRVRRVQRHRQPQHVHAEVAKVARRDLLRDAGPVAAIPAGDRRGAGDRAVVGRIAVQEAVDKDEIHHAVVPVERVRLGVNAAHRLQFAAQPGVARLRGHQRVGVAVVVGGRLRVGRVSQPHVAAAQLHDVEFVVDILAIRHRRAHAPVRAIGLHRDAGAPAVEAAAHFHARFGAVAGVAERRAAELGRRAAIGAAAVGDRVRAAGVRSSDIGQRIRLRGVRRGVGQRVHGCGISRRVNLGIRSCGGIGLGVTAVGQIAERTVRICRGAIERGRNVLRRAKIQASVGILGGRGSGIRAIALRRWRATQARTQAGQKRGAMRSGHDTPPA